MHNCSNYLPILAIQLLIACRLEKRYLLSFTLKAIVFIRHASYNNNSFMTPRKGHLALSHQSNLRHKQLSIIYDGLTLTDVLCSPMGIEFFY